MMVIVMGDISVCNKCNGYNVSYDYTSGKIECRDCETTSKIEESNKVDFEMHAKEQRTDELNKMKSEMNVGVEYDVDNSTFVNVKKADLE